MAKCAIYILVAAALLGNAASASVSTLPGGALLKDHEAEGGVDRKKRSHIFDKSDGEQVDGAFESFMLEHKHEYKYGTAEYDMRKALFSQRLSEVNAHNAKPENERLWTAATSIFSDHTEAELKAARGLKKNPYSPSRAASLLQSSSKSGSQPRRELPETMSWTNLTTANKVKTQGGCGSCWAFATISVLEAHYEIYKQPGDAVRTFSAQQTVDCTPNPHKCGGDGGCQGATVELGLAWILANGLATDAEVAYRGQDGRCGVNGGTTQVLAEASPNQKGGASFGLLNFSTLPVNEGYPLREALVRYGPVAVSLAAGSWYSYSKGVFNSCKPDAVIDHAVTAYGYGVNNDANKTKYWNIRNSWGPSWGESGFIRIFRQDDREDMTDDERHCGTDNEPQVGLGCEGGPASVKVCGMCGMLYDSALPYFRGSPNYGGSSTQTTEDTASLSEATADASNTDRLLEDEASLAKFKSDGEVVSVTGSGDTHAAPKLLRAEAQRH